MSTIVRQNVQSCFDTLTLKLNPTLKSQSLNSNKTGWSYIESLSNASNLHEEKSGELEVYVHPLVKRSSCMLSDRSLDMCTENLGSETGSDIIEDDDIISMMSSYLSSSSSPSSLDSEGEESAKSSRKPHHHKKDESRKAGYESIPPPLTTMCGAHNMRVQPHRESGRLVMTVVTTSPRRSSILAKRHNGRLSMSLMEDFFDDVEAVEEEEEEEVNDETNFLIDEREEESVEEEEDQSLEEDTNGINKEVGDKFGIGEFQRLSRCKEGGRGTRRLINLETYCVAT